MPVRNSKLIILSLIASIVISFLSIAAYLYITTAIPKKASIEQPNGFSKLLKKNVPIAESSGTTVTTKDGLVFKHGTVENYKDGIVTIQNDGVREVINLFEKNKPVQVLRVTDDMFVQGQVPSINPVLIKTKNDLKLKNGEYVSIYFGETYISLAIKDVK